MHSHRTDNHLCAGTRTCYHGATNRGLGRPTVTRNVPGGVLRKELEIVGGESGHRTCRGDGSRSSLPPGLKYVMSQFELAGLIHRVAARFIPGRKDCA